MTPKCTRRGFLAGLGTATAGFALAPYLFADESKSARPNILLITADDMNFDSLGVTGCKVPDITPNIDALASQGMRFEHAHVTIAVCQPSRSALMTGRYPHRNGAMGFEPIKPDVPTLQESLSAAGYLNGIMAKVVHLAPKPKFHWDVVIEANDLVQGRDPNLYFKYSKAFFDRAKSENKPFFLMANSQDPHRPFPGTEQSERQNHPKPSRTYKPEEITVPGFLPNDIPGIREEIAQYFSGVRRCDDTVGQILRALKESGMEGNTLVMFLSDNGISMPFAKANCYNASTATPLIVRWPEKVKPGVVNKKDFVSGVDFTPTVLDVTGAKPVSGMDGRSFLPLLKGKAQDDRDKVFTFFNTTSANNDYPMRCVRNAKFSYIYNSWADGKRVYQNEAKGGMAFKAMASAAAANKEVAERVKFFEFRTPEEFYDLTADPNELKNLIDDPKCKDTIKKLRAEMLAMMKATGDPLLDQFTKLASQ